MTEIDAYTIELEGKFSNEITVKKIKVFPTAKDANEELLEIEKAWIKNGQKCKLVPLTNTPEGPL